MKILPAAVLAATLFCPAAGASPPAPAEGRLAQLYAPRPPAGSAFVRVLNPGAKTVTVAVAGGAAQPVGPATRATRYAIVPGGAPYAVQVAGSARRQPAVAAGSFTTLVLDAAAPTRPLAALADGGGSSDALKAEIRFYNLAAGCAPAVLALAGNGAAVFNAVAAGTSAARAINPVSAPLVARCGSRSTATFTLPALQPGDHYSLFLTGTAAAPVLQGQRSGTDPVGR